MKRLVCRVVVAAALALIVAALPLLAAAQGSDVPVVEATGIAGAISAVLGLLVSLAVELVPPFVIWWDECEYRRQIVVGAGVVIALLMLGADAIGAIELLLPAPFFWHGFWPFVMAIFQFIGVAQTTYTVTRDALPRKQNS